MSRRTIRNKYDIDVIVEEGKYYYVESDVERYTSGVIYVKKITKSQIVFEPITAQVPEGGLRYEGIPACDFGSAYATWIIAEEFNFPPQSEIAISFDSLMI